MASDPRFDRDIIVIMFDDVSARKFKLFNDGQQALYGGTVFNTPNMDAEWVRRGKAFPCVVHPICTTTRASFLTGRHAFKIGTMQLVDEGSVFQAPSSISTLFEHRGYNANQEGTAWYLGKYASTLQLDTSSDDTNILTLPRYLKDNLGYKTGMFGKSHTAPAYRYLHNNNLGFNYFKGTMHNNQAPTDSSSFNFVTWGSPYLGNYATVAASGVASAIEAGVTYPAGLTAYPWITPYTGSATGYGLSGKTQYSYEDVESFDDGTYTVTYVSGTFQEADISNAYSSYLPLGYVPSTVKFTPVASHTNIPDVYAKCENFNSTNSYNGVPTSATFPSRGKKLGYDQYSNWAGRCIQDGIEWIKDRQSAGERYFAYINPNAPHLVHQMPPLELLTPSSQANVISRGIFAGYVTSSDFSNASYKNFPSGAYTNAESGYFVMEALDTMLGELFRTVDWDRTDIFIIGDNGDESTMAEVPDSAGNQNTKRNIRLHGLQVPLLVLSNRVNTPATYSTKLVTQMDLFNTILADLQTTAVQVTSLDSSSFFRSITSPNTDNNENSYRKYCFLEIGDETGTSGTTQSNRTIVQLDPAASAFSGPYHQITTREIAISGNYFTPYSANTVSAGLINWEYSGSGTNPLSTSNPLLPQGGLLFYTNDEFTLSGIVPSSLKNAFDGPSPNARTVSAWNKFVELSGYYTQETGRTFNISTLEFT